MKVPTLSFLGILCLFMLTASSQDSTLCDKQGPRNSNDKIQEKVYKAVKLAKEKGLADTTLKRLQKDYDGVKKGFNDIYKTMTADIGLFNKRSKVCEKYKTQLESMIEKAEKFNSSVFVRLNMSPPASVGVDDIIQVIEWIWKLGEGLTEIRQKQFYKALEWMEWKDI